MKVGIPQTPTEEPGVAAGILQTHQNPKHASSWTLNAADSQLKRTHTRIKHLQKLAKDLHALGWHLNPLTLQAHLLHQIFTCRARHLNVVDLEPSWPRRFSLSAREEKTEKTKPPIKPRILRPQQTTTLPNSKTSLLMSPPLQMKLCQSPRILPILIPFQEDVKLAIAPYSSIDLPCLRAFWHLVISQYGRAP